MTNFGDEDFDAGKYLDELMAKRESERAANTAKSASIAGLPTAARHQVEEPVAQPVTGPVQIADPAPTTIDAPTAEEAPLISPVPAPAHVRGTHKAPKQKREKKPKGAKPVKPAAASWQRTPKAERRSTGNPLNSWWSFTKRKLRGIKKWWIAVAVVVLLVAGTLMALGTKYSVVTVTAGMDTTSGPAAGMIVLVDKSAKYQLNDLVVGKMTVNNGTQPANVLGTVYGMDNQSIALYDGKLIWRLPFNQVEGLAVNLTPAKK